MKIYYFREQYCDQDILFLPISDGFANVVDFLIRKGANPTARIEGMTPLEWAEAYGHKPVVKVLLKYGAKPISKEQAAQNRFVLLSRNAFDVNSIPEMEKALQNGADSNADSER